MKQGTTAQFAPQEVENRRNLYLVFTRTNTFLSTLIRLTKGSRYTHAALALDENLNQMYSFGRKTPRNPFIGVFHKESLDEGVYVLQRQLPGMVLQLSVTTEQYETVSSLIADFVFAQEQYGYNYKALFRNLFGKKLRSADSRRFGGENRFLCSEFVYHVLEQSGICSWQVMRESVLPEHLLRLDGDLIYKGDMKLYGWDRRRRQDLYMEPAASMV